MSQYLKDNELFLQHIQLEMVTLHPDQINKFIKMYLSENLNGAGQLSYNKCNLYIHLPHFPE